MTTKRPRGAPRKPDNERRTVRVSIFLTPDEAATQPERTAAEARAWWLREFSGAACRSTPDVVPGVGEVKP